MIPHVRAVCGLDDGKIGDLAQLAQTLQPACLVCLCKQFRPEGAPCNTCQEARAWAGTSSGSLRIH
jgi:hypothetical protein